MARGDLTLFEEFSKQMGDGEYDFSADTLKAGIVDNVITPTAADSTPTWGDYSTNEVSTGGGYPADGIALTTVTYTEVDGVATLDADDLALSQDAGGFTDGYWVILYDSTHASDQAFGFIELDGPISEVAGPININFNASGILTTTVTP